MDRTRALGWTAALLAGAFAAAAAGPAATLRLELGEGVTLDLALVRAGSFEQGSPPGERGRQADEARRQATLAQDFYIGTHEVTVLQFTRFVQETGYRTEAEKGTSGGFGWDGKALAQNARYNWRDPGYAISNEHPVTIVTYDDALAFAAWLQRRAGRLVTLPTEAEWEYAARGGSRTRFSGGDSEDALGASGWYKANAPAGAQPVGKKKPNGFGLYDTAGNVYEWCRDWYGPYLPGPVTDPLETRQTLSDRPRRVLRGGSWLKGADEARSAARYRNTPGSRNADNGFRVVASAQAPVAAAGQPLASSPAAAVQPSSGGSALAILIPLAFGGLLVLVLALVALKLLGSGRRGGAPRVKTGRDGFTISAPRARPGETIRYRYSVGGRSETGEMTVPADPGQGMFVFTGEAPSAVEILGVLADAGAPRPQRPRGAVPPPLPREQPRRRDDDEPFRGFPSAY